jgi:predicted MFS family arabinose efflux permease
MADSAHVRGAAYEFQPHERPLMPGSPATPEHPLWRRIGYALIGVLIALTSGLSNGLLIASLPQIQGHLGLTPVEGGWLVAAYAMTNVCTGFLLVRARQQFGLQHMTRVFLLGFVALTGAQVLASSFAMELGIRAAAGVIAGGLTPLSFFYIMQAMPARLRMGGIIIGLGLTQVALPLARVVAPVLLSDGDVGALHVFEFGLALVCLGAIALLRLPPSERAQVFERLDGVTFILLASGLALLTAVLVQGRIVWWSTPWLGYATAGSIAMIGAALLIEHRRATPLLDTRWIASLDILRFAAVAAVMRILLSEQNYGSLGLLTAVGMSQDQLVGLYAVVTGAALAGLVLSVARLDPTDLVRPIMISVALIMAGALIDARATNLTRPADLYVSQGLIGFAAVYFLGPTLLLGVVRAIARGPSYMVSFSAVFGIAQTIGGLGGTALLGTFQIIRARFHAQELAQSLVMTDPQVALRVQQLGGAYSRVLTDPALRQAEGVGLLTQQVTREANVLAFNDVFLLLASLAGVALLLVGGRWLQLRRRGVNPLAEEMAAIQRMRTGSA